MKEKYTVGIIDDDVASALRLTDSLAEIDRIGKVLSAYNPKDGRDLVLKFQPQLLFLDIEMPGMNGIDFLKSIKNLVAWPMQVVFYTAYNQYMLEAIRESAFDYLLKPYLETEFLVVINRFLCTIDLKKKEPLSLQEAFPKLERDRSCFLITTVRGYRSLKIDDVGYFEYNNERKHWYAFLEQESIQLKRKTSADDITQLAPEFTQINQQQIVNIRYLKAIEGKKCILFEPFHEHASLAISRFFFNDVQDRFFIM